MGSMDAALRERVIAGDDQAPVARLDADARPERVPRPAGLSLMAAVRSFGADQVCPSSVLESTQGFGRLRLRPSMMACSLSLPVVRITKSQIVPVA